VEWREEEKREDGSASRRFVRFRRSRSKRRRRHFSFHCLSIELLEGTTGCAVGDVGGVSHFFSRGYEMTLAAFDLDESSSAYSVERWCRCHVLLRVGVRNKARSRARLTGKRARSPSLFFFLHSSAHLYCLEAPTSIFRVPVYRMNARPTIKTSNVVHSANSF